jgi:hypothetical protein
MVFSESAENVEKSQKFLTGMLSQLIWRRGVEEESVGAGRKSSSAAGQHHCSCPVIVGEALQRDSELVITSAGKCVEALGSVEGQPRHSTVAPLVKNVSHRKA